MINTKNYFKDIPPLLTPLFQDEDRVWEAIKLLPIFLNSILAEKNILMSDIPYGANVAGNYVYIGENTIIEPGAYIQGPVYIGNGCTIRHGSYIRGNSVILDNSIVGHATEVKNSIFFPHAKAPHFSYVGDSILGHNVNIGAGTILSNVRFDRCFITIRHDNNSYDTGLKKFGAVLGDNVQTGCNVVINPGALIAADSLVAPNVCARGGVYPPGSFIK